MNLEEAIAFVQSIAAAYDLEAPGDGEIEDGFKWLDIDSSGDIDADELKTGIKAFLVPALIYSGVENTIRAIKI